MELNSRHYQHAFRGPVLSTSFVTTDRLPATSDTRSLLLSTTVVAQGVPAFACE